MKQILQLTSLVLFSILLSSCAKENNTPKPQPRQKLLVLLYDISKSNDDYAILKENHLKDIFSKIAFHGGGKFYAILIQSDSKKQEIFEYQIPAFDTLDLKGNTYQIKRRRKENRKILQSFYPKQDDFVQQAKKKLLKPKTEDYTDLENALDLSKVILNQTIHADRDKSLMIISDGINDLPPVNGEDKMKTLELNNVHVILVRPSRKKYIKADKISIVNSIQDAIINL